MTLGTHHYQAYGLLIESDLKLPLRPAAPTRRRDVRLRLGSVPGALPAPEVRSGLWQAAPGDFLLRAPGVARYRVTGGTEIVVDPEEGRDEAMVAFVTGSVLGACLQQRGIATLHASAIHTPAGAVLFAGRSGTGKSTLLAALAERGYAMLTDDITAIELNAEGHPVAWSGDPSVRLWADAMDKMGWDRTRSRGEVRESQEKYAIPIGGFADAPVRVRGIFVLMPHNRKTVKIDPVAPVAAFAFLVGHTYRRRFLPGLGGLAEHFRVLHATAGQAWLAAVARPIHPFMLDVLSERIDEHLTQAKSGCKDAPGVPPFHRARQRG